jgi:MoaA/NifB/PqqE/SkfB family radical SAM enzyme
MNTLHYKTTNGVRAIRRWVIPYLQSRIRASEFRPVLCYLYTEWNCNIDCHYCFQYDSHGAGIDLETARSAIDWLKSIGCRVVPLMGGEPLLRPDLVVTLSVTARSRAFSCTCPPTAICSTSR